MLKTVQLGQNRGLQVSQLCLGTMNFGVPGQVVEACEINLEPDDLQSMEELYRPVENLPSIGYS